MQTYLILLRGINVGGKNKVSMPELKAGLEERGFTEVLTYINSGNIILKSELDEAQVAAACSEELSDAFGLEVPVCVFGADEYREALLHAPNWWNSSEESKHNALFVIPPASAEEISAGVGEAKPEYEQVAFFGRVIFWSAPLATFSHTRWSKVVANKAAYNAITIRNANTTLKLLELMEDAR